MTSDSVNKPWLENKEWAAREIHCPAAARGCFVVLAIVFFAIPGVIFLRWALIHGRYFSEDFVLGSMCIFFTGALVYLWRRHQRYGDSICRLLTLPGIVGGWFKADVECKLPFDTPGPVTVQLKNAGSRGMVWEMTQEIALEKVAPAIVDGRSIVPVRLRVPRDPAQEPLSLTPGLFNKEDWTLVVKKEAAGVDFRAEFHVPIYDIPDAPASEQRAESL